MKHMKTEQDIYLFEETCRISHAYHFFSNHTLVYLYSGRLHLRNQCGETLSIERGDSAFIGRDSYSHLYAEPEPKVPCRMLFFSLPRQFLCEFYQTLDVSVRKSTIEGFSTLHRLKPSPEIESLFQSWVPYIQEKSAFSEAVLRLKMIEAVYTLLNTDKRYIPTLFDFAGKCPVNLFDLLKEPGTKEIQWLDLSFEPRGKTN